jgi:hypothetical protein
MRCRDAYALRTPNVAAPFFHLDMARSLPHPPQDNIDGVVVDAGGRQQG